MEGHLVSATSNPKIRSPLENFTFDAERWLAALYWCVRTSYGDDAARAAADCWLRVFEEQLEGSSDLTELTRITATAIALFVSRLVLAGQRAHPADCNRIFTASVGLSAIRK
jgi:ABC-type proline/glycine betaine transport system substrate-binding protein